MCKAHLLVRGEVFCDLLLVLIQNVVRPLHSLYARDNDYSMMTSLLRCRVLIEPRFDAWKKSGTVFDSYTSLHEALKDYENLPLEWDPEPCCQGF